MFCNNSIVASLMGIFAHSDEYMQQSTVYNFTSFTPFDNKSKMAPIENAYATS